VVKCGEVLQCGDSPSNKVSNSIRRRIDSMTPRRYPYFDVVVGLVWSHDPKSCAGGSVCFIVPAGTLQLP
jgi:hypothetical protein